MNTLLQDALLSTKHVNHAAIIRRKDYLMKAGSPHIQLNTDDVKEIERIFSNPRDARTNNYRLTIMNIPYKPVRVDDLAVYGKKDQNGIIVAKTKQYLILGTYDPDMVPSIAAEAVEKLGKN